MTAKLIKSIEVGDANEFALAYLTDLYAGIDRGYISVGEIKTPAFVPVTDLQRIVDISLAMSPIAHVYHSWGVLGAVPDKGRGSAGDVYAFPGFMLDVDIAGPAHTETRLPKTVQEVLEFLDETGFLKPTAVRHSGNGLYLDFWFDQPFSIESEADREKLKLTAKAFERKFIALAAEKRGWKLDAVSDLPRVTRLPWTWNHKTLPPKPVILTPYGCGQRYSFETLAKLGQARGSKSNIAAATA